MKFFRLGVKIIFIFYSFGICFAQSFSTYFGWNDSENNVDVEIVNNEIYVAGNSNSSTTLASTSSYFGYIAKYTIGGSLIWVKILDGNQDDIITKIKAKSNGNIIICGYTSSSVFLGKNVNGPGDAFIVELDASSNVVWSDTYGGSGMDAAYAMDLKNDTIWIGGITTSTNFPTTTGAFMSSFSGALDIFLLKTNTNGNVLYSSYLGSSSFEDIHDLKIDHSGNIIITGETGGLNFPTLNCFQCSLNTMIDGYLAKFSPSGSLLFSTYFGGNHIDDAYCLEINTNNEIYLIGNTQSSDLATLGANYQTNYGGNMDIWFCKFSSTGSLLWSNYFGSNADEKVYGSAFTGNYLLFTTESSGNISYYLFHEQTLLCSDTIGGSAMDIPYAINQHNGYIYLVGATSSTNFPILNAQQQNLSGSDDAFLIKDNQCQVLTLNLPHPLKSKKYNVFPNPFSTTLNTDFKFDKVEIYDSMGQLVYSGINISHPEFKSGVYLFQFIKNGIKIYSSKVIKK